MDIRKHALKGVKWNTIGSITLAFSAILKVSVLARYLEKEDFGLMALVTFVLGFINLFSDMGITTAILHRQNINVKEYSSLYWLNIFISCVLYFLLILISPFISDFYGEQELKVLIPLMGLILIFSGLGRQFKTIEQKNLLFKAVSIVEIVATLLSFLFAVILAIEEFGVFSLVYSALLQYLLCNVGYFLIGLKKHKVLFHFKFSETKPFLKVGSYQMGGQIANYFNRDIDILIIGKFFSTDILGSYSLAKQLVFRPSQLINPILINVASPTLALYQKNINSLKTKYLKIVNLIALINIPIYLTIILFAPWIVKILYGNGFENVIPLVRILSIYMILRAIANPVGSLMIATGRTDIEFKWNLLVLMIMPLFIVVGSQFGIIEVAIAITGVMLLLYIPGWKILIKNQIEATLKEYVVACFYFDFKYYSRLLRDTIK